MRNQLRTLLIYGLMLIFVPLVTMSSLLSGRTIEAIYENLPTSGQMSAPQRQGLALGALHFLESQQRPDKAVALLAAQTWPESDQLLYTDAELSHMVDVKVRMGQGKGLMWVAGLSLVFLWVWSQRDRDRLLNFWQSLQNGMAFLVMVSLGAALLVILLWPLVNVYFHALFFGGLDGNWQFPVDSGLITLFPLPFWFAVAISWVGRTIALGVVGTIVGGVGRYRLQQGDEPAGSSHNKARNDMAIPEPGEEVIT